MIKCCLLIFIFQVRFLCDLVNCHVIVAGSLLSMFDNFVEVTLEDNIPQVDLPFCTFFVVVFPLLHCYHF